jgi:hypothetical protein
MFTDYNSQQHSVNQTIAALRLCLSAEDQPESVLLEVGLQQEQAFRARTIWELRFVHHQLSNADYSLDVDELKTRTLLKMQNDLEIVEKMNRQLAEGRKQGIYKAGNVFDSYNITFSLGSNKLEPILSGSITESGKTSTFESAPFIIENYLESLLGGDLPVGYDLDYVADQPVLLYDASSPTALGNSKGTCLKAALYTSLLTSRREHTLADLLRPQTPDWQAVGGFDINESATVHLTPLPKGIEAIEGFDRFTYHYSDERTPQALAFVHSGYAFGGSRGEEHLYPYGKPYTPQDCSSWLASLTGCASPFTTWTQLVLHRKQMGQPDPDAHSQGVLDFEAVCNTVKVSDPQRDIRPGQIMAYRSFDLNKDPEMQGPGNGGHTGLVLGFHSQGAESTVRILSYSRNMPNQEGFGVQDIAYHEALAESGSNKRFMFFSPTAAAAAQAKALATTAENLSHTEEKITRLRDIRDK